MDSKFRITISAVDKATAIVRGVKESFSKITRPLTDMQASVVSLGKETGLDKVGKSILDIGVATGNLASKMAGVFPVLGGLSVPALAGLAARWGDVGTEVGKTSRIIGDSTSELQEFRAAARRADVAPEALDNSLKSLGATMEDVFYYRASPEAITALRQMGVQFQKTATGAPNVTKGFLDIADAVKRLQGNPLAQRKFLQSIGLSEDLLPLLQLGRRGILEYIDAYRQTHGMISAEDVVRATRFKDSMINLGDALGGVATRMEAIADNTTDFNDAMAKWIGGGPSPFADLPSPIPDKPFTAVQDTLTGLPFSFAGWIRGRMDKWWNGDGKQPVPSAAGGIAPGSTSPPPSPGIYINALPPPPTVQNYDTAPGSPPSVNDVSDAAAAMAPKVSVEVLFKNAPPGTQIRARDTNTGSDIPARVQYSMPTSTMP
jgi:hypothetical protein